MCALPPECNTCVFNRSVCLVTGQTAVDVAVESGSICLKIVLESKGLLQR